jgi:hypothetical protein
MTMELGVALFSLAASILAAGRVVFVTENRVTDLTRRCDLLEGQNRSQSSELVRLSTEKAALSERVNNNSASIASKASIESVSAVRESVDRFRMEIVTHLERIEKKLDSGR